MAYPALARVVVIAWTTTAWLLLAAQHSRAAEPAPEAAPDQPAAAALFTIVGPGAASRAIEKGAVPVDARSAAKYFAGHLPGAVHLPDGALRCSQGSMPVRVRDNDELARIFASTGIARQTPVVVYADGDDPLAGTLAAYALVRAGHERVMLLDGGIEAWKGNRALSQDMPSVAPALFDADKEPAKVATLDDVRASLFDDQITFVDARPAAQFRGEGKLWRRNGHIPGAANVDWKSLMDKDNPSKFRPRKEIEKLLADAGVEKTDDLIVYCGTGREATLLAMYLRHTLAWPSVRLFEGSWTEYSATDELPVSTGDDPYVPLYRDGDVMISGQPTQEMLQELAADGVAVVINCRTAEEAASVEFAEPAFVRSLGLSYVELPLGGKAGYEPADADRLAATLREHAGKKVLIHCASGGRATTLWLSHMVRGEGMSVDQAMERARKAGMLRTNPLERLIGKPVSGN